MKEKIYILGAFLLLMLGSCQKDSGEDSGYLESTNIHIVYKQLGESLTYSTPPKIAFINNTEQIKAVFQADEHGNVTIDKLLPGEYSINVTGALTAEEVAVVTNNPDANKGTLTGSLNNVKLRVGQRIDLSSLSISVSASNPIILKELYYAGSRTPSNMTYRNDAFYTIHNNSLEEMSLGDYYIASVENYGGKGIAGPLWPDEQVGNYKNIYAMTIWKIVSNEDRVKLAPGQDAVIAVMAAGHNKNSEYNLSSPVDLSNADFEAYVSSSSNTYPDFKARNMQLTFWPSYSYLWRISVFGQGIVLIKATTQEMSSFETVTLPESFQDPFEDEEYWLCKKIPLKYVMDAVDLSDNKTTTISKRFPPVLDAGIATVEDTYTGKSVIRKVQSVSGSVTIYQDTNNSSEDFEINDAPLTK